MKVSDYPEVIKYITNLNSPKEFYLFRPRPRRGSTNPIQPLRPLEVGDYIQLPTELQIGARPLLCSYKVTYVEGEQVELELINFRMTHVENEDDDE